jgi:N-acetylglutamate synthase-like GNAT family acetyltransferase
MAVTAAALEWIHEGDPCWDADRERVFATVPEQVFRSASRRPGEPLSSDWWRVEQDGRVVGYGWLDDVWGDAEILLAVDGAERGRGIGGFIVDRLEQEAAARGLNYVLNVVRADHPQRAAVSAWFAAHGFTAAEDGRLRKHVRDRAAGAAAPQPRRGADDQRQARYLAERERAAGRPRESSAGSDEPMGPGHEEQGGYVDVDQHRF